MVNFFSALYKERGVIWNLSINDVKARFASSGLGAVWSFITPLMNIFVFWIVFQVGFKNPPIEDVPFMVWYLPAFLSWNYFSETLVQVTNSLLEYRYLVKKVNFETSVIPVIKVVSYGMIHLVFIWLIILLNFLYGINPSWYYLQVIYYFICMFALLCALGWLLSAVAAFFADVINVVGIVTQIGFWATPIFWNPESMNPIVVKILKFNPMYYICQGYRNTFIYKVGFWEDPLYALYFWMIVLCVGIVGIKLFVKLRPQFDDVL